MCVSQTDGMDRGKIKREPFIGVFHGPLACEPQGYAKTLKKHTSKGAIFFDCEIEQRES